MFHVTDESEKMSAAYHNHDEIAPYRGLVPGCPRCIQIAADPVQLDQTSLRMIWYGFESQAGWRNELNVQVVNHLERAFALTQNIGLTERLPSWRPSELNPFAQAS
jgi:hypothetical protein